MVVKLQTCDTAVAGHIPCPVVQKLCGVRRPEIGKDMVRLSSDLLIDAYAIENKVFK